MDTTVVETVHVAMPDSAAIRNLTEFLMGSVPWLTPAIVSWVASILASLPIVGSLLGLEFVGLWLARLSPFIRTKLGEPLATWRWLILPLIGAFIGDKLGSSALGLVAGGVWGMVDSAWRKYVGRPVHESVKSAVGMATKNTAKGAHRARHAAIVLALGLGAMGVASQAQAWTLLGREVVPSVGVGVVQDIERDGFESASGFGFGQARMILSDHINFGVRISGDMRTGSGQPFELHAPRLEYSLAWVF